LILFPLNVIISDKTYSKTLETAFSTECIYVLILSSISNVATSVYFKVDGLLIGDKLGLIILLDSSFSSSLITLGR